MATRRAMLAVVALVGISALVQDTHAGRVQDVLAVAVSHGRRLSSWIGGPATSSIISENDAVGAIEEAVDADNFGATYRATMEGYRDADAAVYPDSIPDEMGLATGWGGGGGGRRPGMTSEESLVMREVGK